MEKLKFESKSGVADTLLIPLHIRAEESRRGGYFHDPQAEAMMDRIDFDFSVIKMQEHDLAGIIMRVREFDRFARDFLVKNPGGTVVHIGCGLDTRFNRVDNGRVTWFDLDLPEVIDLRSKLIPDHPRCQYLAESAFDDSWIARVKSTNGPFLFIAEGVLMYFPEDQVREFVLKLMQNFPGSDLVCDAATPFGIWLHNFELAAMRKFSARLHWGLKQGRDVETWADGIRLEEDWFYYDSDDPRMQAIGWMMKFPLFGKMTGIYHYQLGSFTG